MLRNFAQGVGLEVVLAMTYSKKKQILDLGMNLQFPYKAQNFLTDYILVIKVPNWNLYMLKVVNNTTRYKKNVYSRY